MVFLSSSISSSSSSIPPGFFLLFLYHWNLHHHHHPKFVRRLTDRVEPMAHSSSGFSEASDLLAAALEQMDGILASNYQVLNHIFYDLVTLLFCDDVFNSNLIRPSVRRQLAVKWGQKTRKKVVWPRNRNIWHCSLPLGERSIVIFIAIIIDIHSAHLKLKVITFKSTL